MKRILALLLAALAALGAACHSEPVEEGVVARVNGSPIYLTQLEAKYDLLHLGWSGGLTPTVGKLRNDYGVVLADLVIQTLIDQALNASGLAVTQEELAMAEAEVRADYPQGVFEEVLVEEYIDLDVWREQLRANLGREKFLREALRPQIKLDYTEVQDYFQEHAAEFALPARSRFILITGGSQEAVQNAVDNYLANHDLRALNTLENISAQELKLQDNRLRDSWKGALAKLAPEQSSGVLSSKSGYEALVLLEQLPERALDMTQAYPLVEKALIERKLQDAFATWLDGQLNAASIQVTQHLLREVKDDEEDVLLQAEAQEQADQLENQAEQAEAGDMAGNAESGEQGDASEKLALMTTGDQPEAPVDEDLAPDATSPDAAALPKATLFIELSPEDAKVALAESSAEFAQGMELPPGFHEIQVAKPGFETWTQRVELVPGEEKTLQVSLTPAGDSSKTTAAAPVDASAPASEKGLAITMGPRKDGRANDKGGRLFVTTQPAGAQVRVLSVGPKFSQGMLLPSGSYEIDVKKKGYRTRSFTVEIAPGKDTTVSVTLQK